jgi:hypothetical protein
MTTFRPLGDVEQEHLCEFIAGLLPVARQEDHPMRDLSKRLISLTMWRWTADGVDDKGIIRQDALKYSVEFQIASQSAIDARQHGVGGLRHEHIVPRARLTREILRRNLQGTGLRAFLSKFCRAAIVTAKEDADLLPRSDMPDGWDFEDGGIYQRYINAGLFKELRIPHHALFSQSGKPL